MTWVWHWIPPSGFADVEMDYVASDPLYSSIEFVSSETFPPKKSPVFRTRSKLSKFLRCHCPPIGSDPVVDEVWQNIISNFAGPESVGFLPIDLIGKDGTTRKFSWVAVFEVVDCIDRKLSKLRQDRMRAGQAVEFEEYVHLENCLGQKHIARDKIEPQHIVISDALRDALAATGEHHMFFRPSEVPTIFGKKSIFGVE